MYLNQGLPGECYLNLESALLSGQDWPPQTLSTLAGKTRKARFTDTCTRGLPVWPVPAGDGPGTIYYPG